MFDPAPSEIASNAVGKVSQFADAFFVIVITFLGFIAWRRGEKDGGKVKHEDVSMPTYLMAHDAAKALTSMADDSERTIALHEKTNALLEDISKISTHIDAGQVHTHRLLTSLRNDLQMRSTTAHPEKGSNGEMVE